MKEFDQQTLAEFNGRDGKPLYIARDGKVYDVSASKLWKGGMHMKRHQAGLDLSNELPAAPHGEEVFERVPQVGTIAGQSDAADEHLPPWLARLFARNELFRRHPHPMVIHFPIVFMFSTTGFVLLALITGSRIFETTAFHCLAAGLLFMPLAMATGFLTWWVNYGARAMRPVRIKIALSFLLMLDAAVLFAWRFSVPDILSNHGFGGYLYLFLICALVPMTSIIGWYGAQLTFPLPKK
jgi:predicted heme/steroid binding protein/uncharacterized membrane protein